jgi:2-hydroxychromene-2-carboxylate isomerase
MQTVGFFYDIACPYAYLASTQIEAIADSQGAQVDWKPILLGGLYKAVGGKDHPAESWPSSKVLHNKRDMARQAELFGVPLKKPKCYPQRTVNTMRLLLAAPESIRPDLSHRIYQAYWVDGKAIGERGVLKKIAAEFDLDISIIDGPEIKQELIDATEEAKNLGHFGVPTFQLKDTFYWGADRLLFVARDLGCELLPPAENSASSEQPTLEFFHDFSSPFSYLASTQMERIAQEAGAKLIYKPILLGGLFKAIGTANVPLFEMTPARQTYQLKDLHDWSAWWGVDFKFPDVFPLFTVTALRVAIQAPEATEHLYRAAWADGLNISEPEVLKEVLNSAGFDGEALLEGTQDPAVKAQLFKNTKRAVEKEVCGVPSMLVNDNVLIWGQDRVGMLEAALDGWVPAGE